MDLLKTVSFIKHAQHGNPLKPLHSVTRHILFSDALWVSSECLHSNKGAFHVPPSLENFDNMHHDRRSSAQNYSLSDSQWIQASLPIRQSGINMFHRWHYMFLWLLSLVNHQYSAASSSITHRNTSFRLQTPDTEKYHVSNHNGSTHWLQKNSPERIPVTHATRIEPDSAK